ncbi:MAG: hypothetical protein KDJ77_16950 [Rhodobiaceae bacterium]|nr:hypothetical protein [Rhodobiaceae bacterium]
MLASVLIIPLMLGQAAFAHGGAWVDKVPAERLIRNLQRKAFEHPNDADALYQLGRAYMISAYHEKIGVPSEEPPGPLKDSDYDEHGIVWGDGLYFDENYFPESEKDRIYWERIQNTIEYNRGKFDVEKHTLRRAALERIRKAISFYKRSIEIEPTALKLLSLAWAYDVAGRTEDAKHLYRRIIEDNWPKERDQEWHTAYRNTDGTYDSIYKKYSDTFDFEMARFITYEAGFYLSALLDPQKDREELSDLKEKMLHLARNGIMDLGVTPLIIPLDRHASLPALVSETTSVSFDLDGLGARDWQWLTPQAGLLVWVGDEPETRIASGHQLFGNVSFHIFWRDGYEALAALDDDGDGWLRGDELTGLAIWADRNADARSATDEIVALGDLGIVGLAASAGGAVAGMPFNASGVEYDDGSTGPSYDWISHPRPTPMN